MTCCSPTPVARAPTSVPSPKFGRWELATTWAALKLAPVSQMLPCVPNIRAALVPECVLDKAAHSWLTCLAGLSTVLDGSSAIT